MPIHTCPLPGGAIGYQWGQHGKCYASRADAEKQAEAAHANGYVEDAAPPVAAGIALIRDGDILLAQRAAGRTHGGTWAVPGGSIEPGEEPDVAACRELLEETGIEVGPAALRLADCNDEGGCMFSTYLATTPDSAEPTLCDEHSASGWFPLTALPSPLHPGLERALGALFQRKDVAAALAMDDSALAMDRDTVRAIDRVGRLRVNTSHISKANVCPYFGREIPRWRELGLNPDRLYQLLRDPEELRKAAHTFNNIQLLCKHIPVSAQDPKKEYVVGCTGSNAVWNPPYLDNSLVVWDNSAIATIESGEQQQLSAAYHYDADMTPGVYEGVPFDGRMTNIVGNHVALVTVGRAGADVIVGDSKPVELIPMPKNASPKAVALRAALAAYLMPALAQDSAPIPYDQLIAADAKPLAIARAAAEHYKSQFDLDAGQLSSILQVAMDEAPADEEDDEEAKKKAAIAKDDEGAAAPGAPEGGAPKPAMDEAAILASAQAAARADYLALRTAEKAVAPLVGEVAAMDSAEAVYRFALDQHGVDHKGVHASALPALVDMAKKAGSTATKAPLAMDSADSREQFYNKYPGAARSTRS